MIFSVLAAIGVLVLAASTYWLNQLIRARNASFAARSGIDVQLTKRHDLVPNLARVVERYAEHERDCLRDLAAARAQAMAQLASSTSPQAESQLEQALATLAIRVEAYPTLKANENFLHLQKTLSEIEEQLAAARRAYNAHVLATNNLIQLFPSSLVARIAGFELLAFFAARPDERPAPSLVTATPTRRE